MKKSPQQLTVGARNRLRRLLRAWRQRRRDARAPSYCSEAIEDPLASYFFAPPVEMLTPHAEAIRLVANRALEHRFDLLGSGWVPVVRAENGHDHDGEWLRDLINAPNLGEARRIWRWVDSDHRPIDWQLDFKSGHRWDEDTWYLDVAIGHRPGMDVKVPWELARMQHLPQLVWATLLARAGEQGFETPETYVREFRNQVLDFAATNPPRFGVNWRGTMDVAIRVTNWLVAHDLFRSCGVTFDEEFEMEFRQRVVDHGMHIAANRDWAPGSHGNHYLADVTGLLFVAAYLPRSPRVDAWLAFAIQELVAEMEHQFQPDGSNFEASTSYHRLSAEMLAYGTALVLALDPDKERALGEYDHHLHEGFPKLRPAPLPVHPLRDGGDPVPLPRVYVERLHAIAAFTRSITQPDGRVPQIGDNDSGRFLKLAPGWRAANGPSRVEPDEAPRLVEDSLDHRHLLAAMEGLWARPVSSGGATGAPSELALDMWLVREAVKGRGLKLEEPPREPNGKRAEPSGETSSGLCAGLGVVEFPDFGLYVYQSRRLYAAIRCGSVGQRGRGGHAHNDSLSFVLAVDGTAVVVDPGSYVYTPDPEQRNLFRSTEMHSTLRLEGHEQNGWEEGRVGLFVLENRTHAVADSVEATRFRGTHHGFGAPCTRTVEFHADRIDGVDRLQRAGTKIVAFHLSPGLQPHQTSDGRAVEIDVERIRLRFSTGSGRLSVRGGLYSPAYGRVESSKILEIIGDGEEIRWSVKVDDRDAT